MDLLAEDVFSSGQEGDFNFGKLTPLTTPQDKILQEIETVREQTIPTFDPSPSGVGDVGITGPTAGLTFSESSAGVFGFDFDEDGPDSGFDGPADPGFGGDGEF